MLNRFTLRCPAASRPLELLRLCSILVIWDMFSSDFNALVSAYSKHLLSTISLPQRIPD